MGELLPLVEPTASGGRRVCAGTSFLICGRSALLAGGGIRNRPSSRSATGHPLPPPATANLYLNEKLKAAGLPHFRSVPWPRQRGSLWPAATLQILPPVANPPDPGAEPVAADAYLEESLHWFQT